MLVLWEKSYLWAWLNLDQMKACPMLSGNAEPRAAESDHALLHVAKHGDIRGHDWSRSRKRKVYCEAGREVEERMGSPTCSSESYTVYEALKRGCCSLVIELFFFVFAPSSENGGTLGRLCWEDGETRMKPLANHEQRLCQTGSRVFFVLFEVLRRLCTFGT